jgi:hypothetical protein
MNINFSEVATHNVDHTKVCTCDGLDYVWLAMLLGMSIDMLLLVFGFSEIKVKQSHYSP